MDKLTIRKATDKDADTWAELFHQLKETYLPYISKKFIDCNYSVESLKKSFLQEINLEKSDMEHYMLIYDEVPVGIIKIGKPEKYYIDGNNYYRNNIEGIGEIKALYVMNGYHNCGIGSEAINYAEKRLKQLNYKMSQLWVKECNIKAIEFYKHQGYKKTNYINNNTKDKVISIAMEKELM